MPQCSRCAIEGPLPVTLFFPAPDLVGPLNPTVQARCCSLLCARDAAQAIDDGRSITRAATEVRTVERDSAGNITRVSTFAA